MKVYVDELPKCCGDCVFCKQKYYYYCDKLHTKLGYFDKDTDCPLISLSEHDKQVRKEVVQEIKKQVIDMTCYDTEEEARKLVDYVSVRQILEMLDNVEEKGVQLAKL